MRFTAFFIPNFLDLIFAILCIVIAYSVIGAVTTRHKLTPHEKGILVRLYFFHLAFACIYVLYIYNNGGDSIGYWREPIRFLRVGSSPITLHQPGSSFVHFLTYPFSQILQLTLWGGTFIFSLFGYFGFVCIYLTCRTVLKWNPTMFGYRLFPTILFLPNMHFWSAGVGKDTMIFFGLALFIYSITNIRKNVPGLILGFYVMFFIRPHIAFVCLIALGCALVVSSTGVSTFAKVGLMVVTVVVFIVISPTVMSFIGVEEDSLESYEDVANIRSQNLSRRSVGSAISMSGYPVPFKIFTFLYRPLFFDGINALGIVVSFENLFYLLLTFSAIKWARIRDVIRLPMGLKVCLLAAGAISFFMSGSLGNLGIIIRQKNMVMFLVVLVCVYLIGEGQHRVRPVRQVIRKDPQLG